MSFEFQKPDFSFISRTGQAVGQTVENYAKAKNYEIDDTQAQKAHEDIMKQVAQQYIDATGNTDTVKAYAFAAKYFQPKMKSETGSQAASRWLSVEPTYKAALKELETKKYDTVKQNVNQQLSGDFPPAALDAIKSGQSSPDQINKQFGTNLNQEDYSKYAGIAPPNPAFQHAADTTDFKQAAAADQPIVPTQQPISYGQGRSIVNASNLPEDQKKSFDPILTTLADKEYSGQATQPGNTSEDFYRGGAAGGLPLTETAKAIGGAMDKQDSLAFKKQQEERKARGAESSLLQSQLKDYQFRMRISKDYGDDGAKAADALYKLTIQREVLDQQLESALAGKHEKGKLAQDPQSIMDQQQAVDNEIQRIRTSLPNFEVMRDKFFNGPSVYKTPIVAPSYPGSAPSARSVPTSNQSSNDPLGIR